MFGPQKTIAERISKYHFEIKHVLVLFSILVIAQVLVSLVQKVSLQKFLLQAQNSYQRDSAERLANLTATSLELLLENSPPPSVGDPATVSKTVEAFNIILSQQLLQRQVEDICLLAVGADSAYAIDNGSVLYNFFLNNLDHLPPPETEHRQAIARFAEVRDKIVQTEEIQSIREGRRTFHVFVPFVPKGEFAGALYMKNSPDFTFITREILSSFNESMFIFTGLILFGLLAMFYISSYTVKERDRAQELLFQERERQLKERIHYQKEALFTKRIYHTHHKAEKVMGFIKEDLRNLSASNIEEIKYRVTQYANYISRVIYDMKWFEPPIQAIRNPIFNTDLNEVIRFIVDNICLRVAKNSHLYSFRLELDDSLPIVHVNEFVVWEILEPLLQNSMDHNMDEPVTVTVRTEFDVRAQHLRIVVQDSGAGVPAELLEFNEKGRKRIFAESVSTKGDQLNSGYGCYLAFEIAKERCGWHLDVENLHTGGCRFTIDIPYTN